MEKQEWATDIERILERNREHGRIGAGLLLLWLVVFFSSFIFFPTEPETPATSAQSILFLVIFLSIFPIILIGSKFFPIIRLPKNKILAYNFHRLGRNLEKYNSSSEEYNRMIEIPGIKRSLKSCEEGLTRALSGLPSFWVEDMESSLKRLLSAVYKINHTIKIQGLIDQILLKEIFDLSKTLYKEKNLSLSLKRRLATIDSLLKKTEEEPIRIPIPSRLLKTIVAFPRWLQTRSMGVRFFVNCLILIPIGCGGVYFFSVSVFPEVSINYVYAAVMVVFAAGISVSAALAR